jgi:hypothetical protein
VDKVKHLQLNANIRLFDSMQDLLKDL